MALSGRLHLVQDAATAFKPVILNNNTPTAGFVPWPNVAIEASYYYDLKVSDKHGLITASTTTDQAGDFSFPPPPPGDLRIGFLDSVSLQVNPGVVVYRTNLVSLKEDKRVFNIWVYVDRLRESNGITAGTISQEVQNAGLPGDTEITAGGPNGLSFVGSRSGADINFTILITPDTSTNLNDFLDLTLNLYKISVGWPADLDESANGVLKKIKSGIANAGTAVNTNILASIAQSFSINDKIPLSLAQQFFNNSVSVTFLGVGFTEKYTWNIKDTKDSTVVILANPCIGYPRNF